MVDIICAITMSMHSQDKSLLTNMVNWKKKKKMEIYFYFFFTIKFVLLFVVVRQKQIFDNFLVAAVGYLVRLL